MASPSGSLPPRFSETFPERFAAALADAQGAIAGIDASAGSGEGSLIDAATLGRIHELYRLRIELEIETAGVLWRTAEVVSAIADTLQLLGRRRLGRLAGPPGPVGITPEEIEANRAGTLLARAA